MTVAGLPTLDNGGCASASFPMLVADIVDKR